MFALTAITLIDQEMSQKLLIVKRVALGGSPSGFMSFCRNLLGLQGAEMHWGALEISTAFNCFAWSVTINLLWTEWLFSGSSSKAKSFWRHWKYLIVEINQDWKSASHGACNAIHPMKLMAGWPVEEMVTTIGGLCCLVAGQFPLTSLVRNISVSKPQKCKGKVLGHSETWYLGSDLYESRGYLSAVCRI